ITGAIFCETRPAIIIKSDCRGEPRKTSAPNRATSNRDAAKAIISIAQHASPNDIGQIELRRAQFTSLSSCANKIPSFFRKFVASSGVSSVTPFASCTDIRESPRRAISFSHFLAPSANARQWFACCKPPDVRQARAGLKTRPYVLYHAESFRPAPQGDFAELRAVRARRAGVGAGLARPGDPRVAPYEGKTASQR